MGAVIALKQFARSVGATAVAVVVVGRHPPAFEDTIDEHVSILWINLPKAALAWLILLPRDFLETLVEGQVVTN